MGNELLALVGESIAEEWEIMILSFLNRDASPAFSIIRSIEALNTPSPEQEQH